MNIGNYNLGSRGEDALTYQAPHCGIKPTGPRTEATVEETLTYQAPHCGIKPTGPNANADNSRNTIAKSKTAGTQDNLQSSARQLDLKKFDRRIG